MDLGAEIRSAVGSDHPRIRSRRSLASARNGLDVTFGRSHGAESLDHPVLSMATRLAMKRAERSCGPAKRSNNAAHSALCPRTRWSRSTAPSSAWTPTPSRSVELPQHSVPFKARSTFAILLTSDAEARASSHRRAPGMARSCRLCRDELASLPVSSSPASLLRPRCSTSMTMAPSSLVEQRLCQRIGGRGKSAQRSARCGCRRSIRTNRRGTGNARAGVRRQAPDIDTVRCRWAAAA